MSESTSAAANPWTEFKPLRDTKFEERDRDSDFEWFCSISALNGNQISQKRKTLMESSGSGKTFDILFGPLKGQKSGCECLRDTEHIHAIITFSGDVSREGAFKESCYAFNSLGLDPNGEGFSCLASVYSRDLLLASNMFN